MMQTAPSLRDQYFQRLARVAQRGGPVHAFGTEILEDGCVGDRSLNCVALQGSEILPARLRYNVFPRADGMHAFASRKLSCE